jgi:hypothetical protein
MRHVKTNSYAIRGLPALFKIGYYILCNHVLCSFQNIQNFNNFSGFKLQGFNLQQTWNTRYKMQNYVDKSESFVSKASSLCKEAHVDKTCHEMICQSPTMQQAGPALPWG